VRKPKGEIWFLASVVEAYKDEKGLTGREAFNYLQQTGATRYITDCWEGLHTTSPQYIVDSVDEYIRTHKATVLTGNAANTTTATTATDA
jgi:hypothetical protein